MERHRHERQRSPNGVTASAVRLPKPCRKICGLAPGSEVELRQGGTRLYHGDADRRRFQSIGWKTFWRRSSRAKSRRRLRTGVVEAPWPTMTGAISLPAMKNGMPEEERRRRRHRGKACQTRRDAALEAGDILWVDFGPPFGHEQGGRRPALVLHHATTMSALRCSSCVRSPASVEPLAVRGRACRLMRRLRVLCLSIRSRLIDPAARPVGCGAACGSTLLSEVERARLAALLGIPVSN